MDDRVEAKEGREGSSAFAEPKNPRHNKDIPRPASTTQRALQGNKREATHPRRGARAGVSEMTIVRLAKGAILNAGSIRLRIIRRQRTVADVPPRA